MTLVMKKFTTRLSEKPNRKPSFFPQNEPKPTDRKHFETVTTLCQRWLICAVRVQSRVDAMTWRLLVTCSCTSYEAVCRGRVWRPTPWRNATRRSATPSDRRQSKSCAKLFQVSLPILDLVVRWPVGELLPTGWPLFLESHGKSRNLLRPFSRPGKSWKTAKVMESHGKWLWCPGIFCKNALEFLFL